MQKIFLAIFVMVFSVQLFGVETVKEVCDQETVLKDYRKNCYRIVKQGQLSIERIRVCGDDRVTRSQEAFEDCLKILSNNQVVSNEKAVECGKTTRKIALFRICVRFMNDYDFLQLSDITFCETETDDIPSYEQCFIKRSSDMSVER